MFVSEIQVFRKNSPLEFKYLNIGLQVFFKVLKGSLNTIAGLSSVKYILQYCNEQKCFDKVKFVAVRQKNIIFKASYFRKIIRKIIVLNLLPSFLPSLTKNPHEFTRGNFTCDFKKRVILCGIFVWVAEQRNVDCLKTMVLILFSEAFPFLTN